MYEEPLGTPPYPPIVCHECGEQCMRSDGSGRKELGEYHAREMGWKGFSYLRDRLGRLIERIGCCPQCKVT